MIPWYRIPETLESSALGRSMEPRPAFIISKLEAESASRSPALLQELTQRYESNSLLGFITSHWRVHVDEGRLDMRLLFRGHCE